MIKRTTDEWEALLDGWVYDKQPDKLLGARERFAKVREQEKAAPEAVAEVVRLRRALEELRDHYIDREARSRERLESVTDEREQSHLARFAHSHKRTHEALARILEAAADHAQKEGNDE